MSTDRRVCVVKLGGSLLGLSDLHKLWEAWFEAERTAHPNTHWVVIVGGGKLVDDLRELHTTHALSEVLSHLLAIDLMDVNTRVVGSLLPVGELVDDFAELLYRIRRPHQNGHPPYTRFTLFSARQFLRKVEPHLSGLRLVTDWSVTSDSIAARLAVVLKAERLVLLKRHLPGRIRQTSYHGSQGSLAGFVDEFFPEIAKELPVVQLVNLPCWGNSENTLSDSVLGLLAGSRSPG